MNLFSRLLPVFFCALLTACASSLPTTSASEEEDGVATAAAPEASEQNVALNWVPLSHPRESLQATDSVTSRPWRHTAFPGKKSSSYSLKREDGRDAVFARSNSSASVLRQKIQVEPEDLHHIRFSWKVPALIEAADIALRDLDDSPVRVVLTFEGDRSKFSTRNALMSELAQTLTGEPMPYATLVYEWCNKREPGTVVINPRTDRIRKLVMESGSKNLGRWLDYERDIRADFEKAFGEAPGALLAVGIMTDSDNTGTTTQAWYGPVRLVPGTPRRVQTAEGEAGKRVASSLPKE